MGGIKVKLIDILEAILFTAMTRSLRLLQAVWKYRAGLVWLGEEPSQSELKPHDSSYLGRGHRITEAH